jgi:hypothetical protein
MTGVNKYTEAALFAGIAFPVVGLLFGGIYSMPAIHITRGREPWLTLLLSAGLAVTVFGVGYLGGIPPSFALGAWLFSAALLLVARRLYGNLADNLERFGLVHALTLVIAIVLSFVAGPAGPESA